MAHWTRSDFGDAWGDAMVTVCYSPSPSINRLVDGGNGTMWMRSQSCAPEPFHTYLDELPRHGIAQSDGSLEHIVISQSPSSTLSEFRGGGLRRGGGALPTTPPGLTLSDDERIALRRNVWVSTPPQTSALHADNQHNLLIQLQGTKRITLVSPHELGGWTNYLAALPKMELTRIAPGRFVHEQATAPVSVIKPLVSVAAPDFQRFPLFRRAKVATLELRAGDALMLPVGWLHEIEAAADAPADALNVAVSYWWLGQKSSGADLLRHLFAHQSALECTRPGPMAGGEEAAKSGDQSGAEWARWQWCGDASMHLPKERFEKKRTIR